MNRISQHIEMVKTGLQGLHLSGQPEELYDPITYILSLDAKRMRPALCLTACEMLGGDPMDALTPALGLEVFHNFTLVHDDIMDQADLRRGKPSVHKKWGVNTAILAGDTMLVKAYQMLGSVKPEVLKPVLDVFSATAIEVCEGQQFDMSFEKHDNVQEEEYINMIRLKTSVLLGAALKIGALVAGSDTKNAQYLYDFGVNIGIAFQIQDDLLDAFGNPEKVGKRPGGDIILNKQTLLRLFAWNHGDDNTRDLLGKSYASDDEKVSEIRRCFENCGARAYVEDQRDLYYQKALEKLNSVDGDAELKAELSQFAEWLILREF